MPYGHDPYGGAAYGGTSAEAAAGTSVSVGTATETDTANPVYAELASTQTRVAVFGVEALHTNDPSDGRIAVFGIEAIVDRVPSVGIYVDTIAVGSGGIGVG